MDNVIRIYFRKNDKIVNSLINKEILTVITSLTPWDPISLQTMGILKSLMEMFTDVVERREDPKVTIPSP